MDGSPGAPARRRAPGWLWVVVPMLLSALVFGAIAVAVRTGGDDEAISGPAGQLPAVVAAAEDLLGTVPDETSIGTDLGRSYGEVTVGFMALQDEQLDDLEFAAEFDRLPDAEARLLGRSLGAIQAELSPTALDGVRGDSDREDDVVFALELSRAAIQAIDPDGAPREQALAVLPFSVQDLTGFDEVATTFATGDLTALAIRIDEALPDAGASELISSVANVVSERVTQAGDEYATEFLEGYNAGNT